MGADGSGDRDASAVGTEGSGDLYRRLIEYSSDLISVLDPDGTIRFTSPSAENVLGYDQADLVGGNALELVHPEDRERVIEAFEALVEAPEDATVTEYRYQTADGDWIWLETRGQNRLEDEAVGGIVVVSRDVTERKRRERALETLHDRTRDLFKATARDAIASVTAETAREVLGYPVTVVRLLSSDGRRLEPVAMTEEAHVVLGERPVYEVGEATAGDAFALGEPQVYEDLTDLDDDYDRGSARAGLFVPIGEHGVLAIGDTEPGALDEEDIQLGRILAANAEVAFDRLEREQELQRQNERLEEFASVISHDLRSPLNVASGRLDMVEAEDDQLEPIERALDRMEALIEDVLALARQGQTVDETEPVALQDLAEQCFVNVSTSEATIEVTTDAVIEADPGRLPEIFENLYRNAVEHGGETVTITVGDLENGFFVEDDGSGIPADQRDRVFESGFSTGRRGTGFGLSIVKQIAEAHGWSVSVTDSAAGGARFEFTGVTPAATD